MTDYDAQMSVFRAVMGGPPSYEEYRRAARQGTIAGSVIAVVLIAAILLFTWSLPADATTNLTSGSLTAGGSDCSVTGRCVTLTTIATGNGTLEVRGTFVATALLECSIAGLTYSTVPLTPIAGTAAVTSLTAPGLWTFSGAFGVCRVRASAYTSGTATVDLLVTDANVRPVPSAGSLLANPVTPAQGGTGGDFSSSTGVLYDAAGTFSAIACASGVLQGGAPPTCTNAPSISGQLTSTLATGTAPFVIPSTTLVPNLYVQRAVLGDTATILATPRAINGVDFNGSAPITVTADANTLSGTTLKSTVVTSSLTSVGVLGSLAVGVAPGSPRSLHVEESANQDTVDLINANASFSNTLLSLQTNRDLSSAFTLLDVLTNRAGTAHRTLTVRGDGQVTFGQYGLGLLHSSAAGVLTSSAITDGELPSALTGKTYNGLTVTTTTGTVTIPNGVTLTGPPSSGTAATVAGAESLTNKKLGSLTSDGFVKTSTGDGTLSVDTATYVVSGGALGTPSSGVATNLTGTAAGLTAGLATALASNPADCGANTFATTIAANGDLTCAQPATTNLSDAAATTTWTPTDASGASLSLTTSSAHYYKLGKLAFVTFLVTWPVTASGASAQVGGLPATAFNSASLVQGCILSVPAASAVFIQITNNGTTFFPVTAGGANVTNAALSTLTIRGSCVYLTT